MKIMTIMGTRPEIIRLADIIKLLDKSVNHILVHTGQNYDKNLNDVFFEDLDLRLPDYQLQCKANSIQEQIGKILSTTGLIMDKEKPDAILILGDTNSGLSSIIAKRKKIIIYHLEAGDRSFDNDVPEELNRRIIDHTSDVNLAYTENSRDNLFKEGIHPKNIYVVGSPIFEVYDNLKSKFSTSTILKKLCLNKKKYFAASIHREENVDKEGNIEILVDTFNSICEKYKLPVVVSTHPRTIKKLKSKNLIKKSNELINWHEPFGLKDFIKLQLDSKCVISDSGTIHEDASILGFPAIAIRKSTEKKESLEGGFCPITGLNKDDVLRVLNLILKNPLDINKSPCPSDYKQYEVSKKVVRIILGTANVLKTQIWGS